MSKKEFPYARMSPITVMEDFPIGTVIKKYYKDIFGDIEDGPRLKTVEGYIFDGTYWFPAYDTWDGWCPYLGNDGDEVYHPTSNKESQALEDWLMAINDINEKDQ